MEFLVDLWLPIVLSAVLVFVVSSIIHMALPVHKGDHRKLPGEDEVLKVLGDKKVEPAMYMFPCPSGMKDLATPEMQAKFAKGPVGIMIVKPSGIPQIGKSLLQWFAYCLVVGVFVAYLTRAAVPADASYLTIFRISGTAGVLGYALYAVQDSIWKGQSWTISFKFVADGVVYGLVTAGAFAGFWPS